MTPRIIMHGSTDNGQSHDLDSYLPTMVVLLRLRIPISSSKKMSGKLAPQTL
eukprot:m.826768 g.826768  ORF g.826768 m.826768 type:complete len:52 (-) comp23414_c0_seq13:4013-4168(-)